MNNNRFVPHSGYINNKIIVNNNIGKVHTVFVGALSYFCNEAFLSRLFLQFEGIVLISIDIVKKHTSKYIEDNRILYAKVEYYQNYNNGFNIDGHFLRHHLHGKMFMGRMIAIGISSEEVMENMIRANMIPVQYSFFTSMEDPVINEEYLYHTFSTIVYPLRILDVSIKRYQHHMTHKGRQSGYGFLYVTSFEDEESVICKLKDVNVGNVEYDCVMSKKSSELRGQLNIPTPPSLVPYNISSYNFNNSATSHYNHSMASQVGRPPGVPGVANFHSNMNFQTRGVNSPQLSSQPSNNMHAQSHNFPSMLPSGAVYQKFNNPSRQHFDEYGNSLPYNRNHPSSIAPSKSDLNYHDQGNPLINSSSYVNNYEINNWQESLHNYKYEKLNASTALENYENLSNKSLGGDRTNEQPWLARVQEKPLTLQHSQFLDSSSYSSPYEQIRNLRDLNGRNNFEQIHHTDQISDRNRNTIHTVECGHDLNYSNNTNSVNNYNLNYDIDVLNDQLANTTIASENTNTISTTGNTNIIGTQSAKTTNNYDITSSLNSWSGHQPSSSSKEESITSWPTAIPLDKHTSIDIGDLKITPRNATKCMNDSSIPLEAIIDYDNDHNIHNEDTLSP